MIISGIAFKVISLIFIIFFLFYSEQDLVEDESLDANISEKYLDVAFLLFLSVLPPIYEELAFDGAFLKSKILKVIGYAGIVAITVHFNSNVYNFPLLIIFLILSYQYEKYGKYQDLRLLVNAILFSLLHLNFWETDGMTFVSFLSRTGGHLIALWLVMNYNLLYGILYHMAWNSSLALFLYFAFEYLSEMS